MAAPRLLVRTMGADQVPGGLDVCVMDWNGDQSAGVVVFGGRIRGAGADLVAEALAVASAFGVARALIDPSPDTKVASDLMLASPGVFALQAGSQHTAASLAEIAYERMVSAQAPPEPPFDAPAQVTTVAPHPTAEGHVVVGVYVPRGEPKPRQAIIDLDGASELERPDGSRMIERVLPLDVVRLGYDDPLRQVWQLAPTTTLPTKGWTVVVSLTAGGVLVHEAALTEGQMMGLANLVPEACRQAAAWIDTQTNLPGGPYVAEFEVFAAQTSIHAAQTASFSDRSVFAGAIHDTGVIVSEWILGNAVAMEQAYPGVNIPAPDPYAVPDVTADTYDYFPH